MQLVNTMEVIVNEHFEAVARRFPNTCRCPHCRLDVLALALNSLPPRYVVSDAGEVYSRAEVLRQQYAADVTIALVQGFNKVSENPRH